jgi:uncharacterized protein YgbK (DUF1537 family)
MPSDQLHISFFGDDFTGSTDAMESLVLAGIRTVLFTKPPAPQQLNQYPGIRAFGVAGTTRSMPPDQMERTLRPAFTAIKQCGAPIVHYKVCSTFDSSPTIGSIGRAIDVGADVFESRFVPVVVGAPSLGRYCVFGNLFARCGAEPQPYRLDRHPSMSRHPTTPMDEADLRLHLAKQTDKSIGLIDVLDLERDSADVAEVNAQIVLIDLLHAQQLARVGGLIARHASRDNPLFVVGSSGVESALAAHWQMPRAAFPRVAPAGPILVISGSCSPVTLGQIEWAKAHGFDEISFDAPDAATRAVNAIRAGRSAIIHSLKAETKREIGETLGRLAREVLGATKIRRMIVAGGDTSGQVAQALGIESMEMVGELTRGSPLVRVAAPNSPADGIEMTFKGGQIGQVDFFGRVRNPSEP